jgi:hypothetical protein
MARDSINVERGEFDQLRSEVAAVRGLIERTRVVLQGENGDNGIRSSVERAHKAIGALQTNIKMVQDAIAALTLESCAGDHEMQVLVVEELRRLEKEMNAKADTDRKWRVGQAIAVSLAVAAILVRLI